MRVRKQGRSGNGNDGEALSEASQPRRVEDTLLVVTGFEDRGGREWRAGDRAPLQSRNVRLAALEEPERFAMEYETMPVDLGWLRDLDEHFEETYQAAVQARDRAKAQGERALRAELAEQGRHDPELERRFAKQEREREEREQAQREEVERDKLAQELALGAARSFKSGFHYE